MRLDGQGAVDIVRNWCNTRFLMGDVAAWMEANNNGAGRNACAIEVDGFFGVCLESRGYDHGDGHGAVAV